MKQYIELWMLFFLGLFMSGISYANDKAQYVSLSFQDVPVRTVLQMLGNETDTNIVVSDTVQGNISVHLNDVPWKTALRSILRAKGLGMQKQDGIIFISPHEVIAEQKRQAYEIEHVDATLAPLTQKIIKLRYARAKDIETIIEDNSRNSRAGNSAKMSTDGLLSSRGRISVDTRTNMLIINDIPESIGKVQRLVKTLDVPVKQVLVDVRIVIASSRFARELGVRWGGGLRGQVGDTALGISGSLGGAEAMAAGGLPSIGSRLGVDLAAVAATGTLGLSLLGKDFLLDLELSAMQDEGSGEIMSSPRVIAQDGGQASIKQSTKVAYSSTNNKGITNTVWKDVPLSLTVKPKIAPNNQIDMALEIVKDSLGQAYNGKRSVDSNTLTTQVLVHNEETVVLGGVYEHVSYDSESKVPLLGDLPFIGRAFRHDTKSIRKRELLIFVTPRIVESKKL